MTGHGSQKYVDSDSLQTIWTCTSLQEWESATRWDMNTVSWLDIYHHKTFKLVGGGVNIYEMWGEKFQCCEVRKMKASGGG